MPFRCLDAEGQAVIAAVETPFDGPWRAAVEEELAQWEMLPAWGIYEP
jgi:hypothetical protein